MIKAKFEFLGQEHAKIVIKGHAKSGQAGHDLVCAGVSSIVNGGQSALLHEKRFTIVNDEGYASIVSKEPLDPHDYVVLHTILRQLETIANKYPKNIQVITNEHQ